MATYNDIYLDVRHKLLDAGVAAVELEAREILCGVLGKTKEEFLRDRGLFAPEEVARKVDQLVARRVKGEPLPYLLGEWDFYGETFKVTPDVLIPRTDTEVLVDWAIAVLRQELGQDEFRFLDLCTGCGCIGVSLARAFDKARGVLLDISQAAIDVAQENCKRHKLSDRLLCVPADVCEAPDRRLLGKFDVLLANPPYITREEMAKLDRSVRDFEPYAALFGGNDGLHYYRAILKNWTGLLRDGGFIAFECGYRQAIDLARLMKKSGIQRIKIVEDTAGIQRVVSGWRDASVPPES